VNIHGAHSYWKQGALSDAGNAQGVYGLELGCSVRRTGAGAYCGGLPPTACSGLWHHGQAWSPLL